MSFVLLATEFSLAMGGAVVSCFAQHRFFFVLFFVDGDGGRGGG